MNECEPLAAGIELMREAARIESDVAEHHANLAAALRHDGQIAEAATAGAYTRSQFSST